MWHDANPWRKRHQHDPQTAEQRLEQIERTCRAGDISLTDAIRAAYAAGQASEQTRLIPGANTIKE